MYAPLAGLNKIKTKSKKINDVLMPVRNSASVKKIPPAKIRARRFHTSPIIKMNGSMKFAMKPGSESSSPICT
jgi:hypothetical protein